MSRHQRKMSWFYSRQGEAWLGQGRQEAIWLCSQLKVLMRSWQHEPAPKSLQLLPKEMEKRMKEYVLVWVICVQLVPHDIAKTNKPTKILKTEQSFSEHSAIKYKFCSYKYAVKKIKTFPRIRFPIQFYFYCLKVLMLHFFWCFLSQFLNLHYFFLLSQ